jgi:predicted metalloprotease with PDZ domain
MWAAPGPNLAYPLPKDRTGLNGYLTGGALKILHVARGGPAERAGFKAGEMVVAIDGETAVTANARLAGAQPGRTLDFTLADGSHRRLTLADYY